MPAALAVLTMMAVGFAQTPGVPVGEITLKGEIQTPTAIITLSRTRPEFMPSTLEAMDKDYANPAFLTLRELVQPASEEIHPRKMNDLDVMLARERR
ncbi:MAG TPA: hypothetical protein ENL08_04820 [Bacteroidetes bacterium]|nr:hypothetical protein [Bacteroidota bacterium]